MIGLRWFALAFLLSAAASAGPRRVALIVGANHGALGRLELHYSHRDAASVADTLIQVGEFLPADVQVLRDPEPAEVLAALDQQLGALKAAGGESMLLFYYSGHADGGALYPAGRALPFAALRQRLESRDATVRIGIIDACSGGGWTGAKGMTAAPAFAVDVPLELAGEGSVLIASSSGAESAHESERLLGSFFTHHLVAALRGAADSRGQGVVTVAEAFSYAKDRTVRDTAAVASEPQHPSFFMNLRGRADLPLARVDTSPSLVELHEQEGPLQLIHLATGLVVLEVPSGRRAMKLAVPPGRYLIRRQGDAGNYSRELEVEAGRSVIVREEELTLTTGPLLAGKGGVARAVDWPLAINDRPLSLWRGLGEVSAGLLVASVEGPSDPRLASSLSAPAYGLALEVRYGLTDRVMFVGGAPGGICLGSSNCDLFASRAYLGVSGLLLPDGPLELAANASLGYDPGPQDAIPHLGITARVFGGGPLAVTLSPQLDYLITTGGGSSAHLGYTLAGQLALQALERLSFDVGFRYNTYFKLPAYHGRLPIGVGVSYALLHGLDLRAQLSFDDTLASGTASPTDRRTLGIVLVGRISRYPAPGGP